LPDLLGYLRSVFESGAEIGPSEFEAALKERAKEAVQALAPEASLADRQGDGAAWSGSWDDKKGDFRDAIESIRFKVWLQKQLA
jgi:hypothetical protein